jgi:hypothetical protein
MYNFPIVLICIAFTLHVYISASTKAVGKQNFKLIINKWDVRVWTGFQWVVTPCSVEVGYERFGGLCCLHLQGEPSGSIKISAFLDQLSCCQLLKKYYVPLSRLIYILESSGKFVHLYCHLKN